MQAPGVCFAARFAAIGLLSLIGCDTTGAPLGLNIPSPGFGGTNRPPLILSASLTQTGANTLRLETLAIDLDGDGLVVAYEQLSGAPAVEQTFFRVGGALTVTFDVPVDDLYTFRVTASDGFFSTDARLSRTVVTPPPPEFDPQSPGGAGTPIIAGLGRYDVNITGQVSDVSGFVSFSQPAIVRIAEPPLGYVGDNPVVIQIDTSRRPGFDTTAVGALSLTSAAPRAGVLTDTFSIRLVGAEFLLTGTGLGDPLAGGSAGVFRPGAIANGALFVGEIDARLVVNGDVLSGTVEMADPTGVVLYIAQISGTRTR
jgi:hypothetical protein